MGESVDSSWFSNSKDLRDFERYAAFGVDRLIISVRALGQGNLAVTLERFAEPAIDRICGGVQIEETLVRDTAIRSR